MKKIKQEYVDSKAVAKYLGISEAAVYSFRLSGTGPAYLKVGRLCRYRISDVEKWIAENNQKAAPVL